MKKFILLSSMLLVLLAGCKQEEVAAPEIETSNDLKQRLTEVDLVLPRGSAERIDQLVANINESLVRYNIQLEKMEFLRAEAAGKVVFFSDTGNKQISSDYVPNDPRNGTGSNVPYLVDGTELGTSSGMTPTQTLNAINSAMRKWDRVTCSGGLRIPNLGVAPFDVGFVQFLLGYGGIGGFFPGTIVHAGILPSGFFNAFAPGGGSSILGVAFTFTWIGDLDQNGKGDVAIKEIYYNDAFNWQDAPNDVLFNGIYDFETVVLHEVGHGLSQAHFGSLFGTPSNGKLHYAPAALMNAGYTVARREITQTDEAGHCSNWGNWPNN